MSSSECVFKSTSEQQQALNLLTGEATRISNILRKASTDGNGVGSAIIKYVAKDTQVAKALRDEIQMDIHRNPARLLSTSEAITGSSESRHDSTVSIILSRIKLEAMSARENQVSSAHESTFRWIFMTQADDSVRWYPFGRWLEEDKPLYWVTGKPGSGKSTLMKFMRTYSDDEDGQRPLLEEHLSRWAKGKPVVIGAYYAWSYGTTMQKTREGLFQSLTYQLLSKYKRAVPNAFPGFWESCWYFDEPTLDTPSIDYEAAIKTKIRDIAVSACVFILIDGMDEFNDNEHELICEFVTEISNIPNVKCCVSSRPWVAFEEAFKQEPSLKVQDLTFPDIKAFVSDKFSASAGFTRLQHRDSQYAEQLTLDVVNKSSGVFLWVSLVVKSLLTGLMNNDRLVDLQRRLDELPTELDALFDRLLLCLDPFYAEQARQYFDIMEAHREFGPPPVLLFALADEECPSFVLNQRVKPFSQSEVDGYTTPMPRRVQSRCRDLLEIYRPDVEGDKPDVVDYLHRTVADYLSSQRAESMWVQGLTRQHDAPLLLCSAYLSMLKGIHTMNLAGEQFSTLVSRCLQFARQTGKAEHRKMIKLLDDLDKTGAALAKRLVSRGLYTDDNHTLAEQILGSGHWILTNPPSLNPSLISNSNISEQAVFGRNFLSLVAKSGIVGYISRRAQRGCLVQRVGVYFRRCDVGTEIWPLLTDVVNTDEDENCVVPLIEELLKHGANPHFSGTQWLQNIVRTPYDTAVRRSDWDGARKWEEVVLAMERYSGTS